MILDEEIKYRYTDRATIIFLFRLTDCLYPRNVKTLDEYSNLKTMPGKLSTFMILENAPILTEKFEKNFFFGGRFKNGGGNNSKLKLPLEKGREGVRSAL